MIKIATSFDSPLNPNIIKRRLKDTARNDAHEVNTAFLENDSTLRRLTLCPTL